MLPDDEKTEEVAIEPLRWPACWLCGKNHNAGTAIYRCRGCGQALCFDSLFLNGGGVLPFTHLARHERCGPVDVIGRAPERAE